MDAMVFVACCLIFSSTARSEDEDARKSPQKAPPSPFGAAIFDSRSLVFLCNGALYSSIYVFTSCRCLSSAIAIVPYHVKRNASRYGLHIFSNSDAINETKKPIANDLHGIENFVWHPFCFKTKVTEPYRKHFGLVVLKEPGMKELIGPTGIISRSDVKGRPPANTVCRIAGIHTDDGRLTLTETKALLMTQTDCLWRLCVPRVGCKGIKENIRSNQELCLMRIGVKMPKLRNFEGSGVTCYGHPLGLIVSTGRVRYPDAPAIVAAMTQFVDYLPTNLEQRNGHSKTYWPNPELCSWLFMLIALDPLQ